MRTATGAAGTLLRPPQPWAPPPTTPRMRQHTATSKSAKPTTRNRQCTAPGARQQGRCREAAGAQHVARVRGGAAGRTGAGAALPGPDAAETGGLQQQQQGGNDREYQLPQQC
eukprot:scaffold268745_cov21-Tisochrysis_lutea.AAC.2